MYAGCDAALLERYPGCESRNPMPCEKQNKQQLSPACTIALSGHSDSTSVCPVLDNSGQR